MQLLKVYYAYFSPGNTTEKVLSQIASSFENYPVESINLTSYDERQQEHHFKENELLIIGVPAYGGRVPVPVVDALSRFSGLNTPVILVATYGNRDIDDTLMELKKNVTDKGFIPIGAASFVCQHTFLKECAEGRPDEEDLKMAKEFGDKLKERLRLLVTYDASNLEVPGSFPYTKPPMGEFPFKVETNDYCIYCMLCADVCPVKAISDSNPKDIDNSKCLRCGSCLRICPTQAKSFTEEPFKALQQKLAPLCGIRKENWYTIC